VSDQGNGGLPPKVCHGQLFCAQEALGAPLVGLRAQDGAEAHAHVFCLDDGNGEVGDAAFVEARGHVAQGRGARFASAHVAQHALEFFAQRAFGAF
jgi:hypothetical protein